MMKMIWLAAIVMIVLAAPQADKMNGVPGYAKSYSTDVYSGYLESGNSNRSLHYVFVESVKGAKNNDPVTLWLNGGPGCSSLLGFLQQIGPFYLEDGQDYKVGDQLVENPYSWHKASNILFLESPAEVGFSYNLDKKFVYNDAVTANDTFNALLNFYQLFPEYAKTKLFIAGESYAGKYIPDLTVLIDKYNLKQPANKISLGAILVGNGVMTFDTLEESQIEYIINKELVDPEIVPLYKNYCKKDFESAQCQTFLEKYDKDTDALNPYSIFDYCYYSDEVTGQLKYKKARETQQSSLLKLIKKHSPQRRYDFSNNLKSQGAPCAYDDGMFHYFNAYQKEYHSKRPDQTWNGPCAENIEYQVDPQGSIESYKYLLSRKINIVLYNGNADSVVPYLDTLKGLEILQRLPKSTYEPWFTGDQHSGFQQEYTGLSFVIVKGGSHQVPQTRRVESLQFFKSILFLYKSEAPTQLTIEEN